MTSRRHDARLALRLPRDLLARIEAQRQPGELSTGVVRRLLKAALPASDLAPECSAEPSEGAAEGVAESQSPEAPRQALAAATLSPTPGPACGETVRASDGAESVIPAEAQAPPELSEPPAPPEPPRKAPTAKELIERLTRGTG